MTTFLFCNIIVSGIEILGPEIHVRRSRFIVCSALMFGIGVALVPQWADNDLVRASGDKSFQFMGRAVIILLNTPYCIGTIVGACSIPPSIIASLALHRRHCMRAAAHDDGFTCLHTCTRVNITRIACPSLPYMRLFAVAPLTSPIELAQASMHTHTASLDLPRSRSLYHCHPYSVSLERALSWGRGKGSHVPPRHHPLR